MLLWSPLETLDPEHNFDVWEYILYTMTASFFIEGLLPVPVVRRLTRLTSLFTEGTKVVKVVRIAPKPLMTIVGHRLTPRLPRSFRVLGILDRSQLLDRHSTAIGVRLAHRWC